MRDALTPTVTDDGAGAPYVGPKVDATILGWCAAKGRGARRYIEGNGKSPLCYWEMLGAFGYFETKAFALMVRTTGS